mgnify:CR=1 FL=1
MMTKKDDLSLCFGQWFTQTTNKCKGCVVQLECYRKMREEERRRAKLNVLMRVPWYRRGDNDEPTYGTCEKCG